MDDLNKEVEICCKECDSLEDALCSIAIWECDRVEANRRKTNIYSTRMVTAFDTTRKEWARQRSPAAWVFTVGDG